MSATLPKADNDQADLASIVEGVARLRADFADLLDRLKKNSVASVKDVAQQAGTGISERAERLYGGLASSGERTAQAIGRHVEERPITTLLIAFGIGLIGGRLLSD